MKKRFIEIKRENKINYYKIVNQFCAMVICSIISMVSFKAILADSKSTVGFMLVAMELINDFNSSSDRKSVV